MTGKGPRRAGDLQWVRNSYLLDTKGKRWRHLVPKLDDTEWQACANQLLKEVTSPDYFAHWAIRHVEPITRRILDDYCPLARHQTPAIRVKAFWAIGCTCAPELLPLLISGVQDPDSSVRNEALFGLIRMGPDAFPAFNHVLSVLRDDPVARVRAFAAFAIREMGPQASAAIPTLISRLTFEVPGVRVYCLLAHTYVEQDAAKVIALLREHLKDDSPLVRSAAAQFLYQILPTDGTISDIIAVLADMPEDCQAQHGYGRNALLRLLKSSLDKGPDSALNDFSVRFFSSAFHPNAVSLAPTIVDAEWFNRIQLSQLRRLFQSCDPTYMHLVEDARQEFAALLAKQPTLGITPDRWVKLPGFVKNHARNVARGLYRRLRPIVPSDSEFITNGQPLSPLDIAILNETRERFLRLVHMELPDLQREVLLQKLLDGRTLHEASGALGVSVSRIRTALRNAVTQIATALRLPGDVDLIVALTEFFGTDLQSHFRPGSKTHN